MRKTTLAVLAAIMLSGAPAMAGISANNNISASDALLIGGTQPDWIDIDGQNRGETDLTLIIRNDEKDQTIKTITPGERFIEAVPEDTVFVIRNASDSESAKVYWHISGYSNLANARLESKSD